ncbi:hypothetical protein NQZ68_008627 [Dissostichus eleginoides]|nr:hypothetical protein NQZ68_008627 [Dissostichus eleginoides]
MVVVWGSGRQRQSVSDAGAPLTCSHSTLGKQNGARDKQQIDHHSLPGDRGPRSAGALPIQAAGLVFWAALPDSLMSQ